MGERLFQRSGVPEAVPEGGFQWREVVVSDFMAHRIHTSRNSHSPAARVTGGLC